MSKHSVQVAIKARDQASKKFGKIGRSAKGMSNMIKTAAAGMAAYLSVRAIANFTTGSLKAFGAQEAAVDSLSAALANLGDNSDETMTDMKDFAAEMQKKTRFGDEAILELMSMGASMGKLSGQALKEATIAAIGLAKAYKMDTVAAMRLVARAAQGDTASLTRYGIKLGEGLTTQQKFNKVLEIGAANFNLATAEADNFDGRMAQLSNTWGDIKEVIGESVAKHFPDFNTTLKKTQVYIENFSTTIDLMKTSFKLSMISMWEESKHYLGTVIPDLLMWFGRNWTQIWTDIKNSTKAIITNMFDNLVNFFKATWSWIKGDGFDFTWTSLLDGFESTLKELPKIAERQMSELEKTLTKQIYDMTINIDKKIGEKLAPGNLNIVGGGSAAAVAAAAATKASGAGKTPGSLAAKESRFLTMRAGSKIDYAKTTAAQVKEQVRQQKETNGFLRRIAKATDPTGGAQLMPINFS